MAANLYHQQTADGACRLVRRSTRQGRRPLPVSMRRSRRVFGSITEEMRGRLDREIAYGMFSESDIIGMALRQWFEKLDNMQFTVK